MATDAKTGQAIFGRYGVGLHNVGSYQAAGHPFITGSLIEADVEHKISFPMVAKSVTVIASGSITAGDSLRVHFQTTASTTGYVDDAHHYTTLSTDKDSMTFDVKCKEIYISAAGSPTGYELFAELTNIPTDRMFDLTGSGVTDAGTNPRSDR
jgi:hypothetical protein|tara:strand:+ start:455 stop:913 length:459 start_codon:yes stop_codon:yes gene_type:complete